MKKNNIISLIKKTKAMIAVNKMKLQVLITAFILIMSFEKTSAQNINTPNKVGPMGVEVNTKTGNLFFDRTDIYIPGRQLDLDISFSYNSFDYNKNSGYGNGWTFMYNMRYRIDTPNKVVVIWGDGREDVYTSNGAQITSPVGFFDSLSQYQAGKYLLRTKRGLKLYFDNSTHKRLTKVEEPNGNFLLFGYTDSLMTSITNNSGQTIAMSYSNGKLASVVDANASPVQTYTYTYDAYGNLSKVTDPQGGTYQYTYLVNGPMSSIKDKNDNVVDLIYYSSFKARELISCNSRTAFSYETTLRTTTVIDFVPGSSNQTTSYIYNEKGWLAKFVGACCGMNISFTYDNAGNLIERKDANGNVYKYTYDNRGNYLTVTDPLNNVTTYSYTSDFNEVAGITDPLGNAYSMNYDTKGNMLQLTKPGNLQNIFTYGSNGDLLTMKDGNNNTSSFIYDAYGYTQKIMLPLNVEIQNTYDGRGNLISGKDANGNSYSFQYDSLNRLKTIAGPLNHNISVAYDKNGNVKSFTDAKGFKQLFFYDASDRVITYKDENGATASFNYDAMNNLVQITDPLGKSTSIKYDAQNRMKSITNALGEGFTFNYDAVGNMTSMTNPGGNTVNYTYDQLHRIVSGTDDLGSIGHLTYDKNGNLSSLSNAAGATFTLAYDNLNRLTRMTDPLGNSRVYTYDNNDNLVTEKDRNNHISSYTYNPLNRITSFTDNNNNTIQFRYDSIGNITKVIDQNGNSSFFQYDALNRPFKLIYPDGTTSVLTYDNNGNITSAQLPDGSLINYTYDSTNRLIAKDFPNGEHYAYGFDAKGRLISASNNSGSVTMAYDDADRIISETFNSHLTAYSYNLPARVTTITYPNGSVVSKSYDKRLRLNQVSLNNQAISNYQYNSVDHITQKTFSNGIATSYQYDLDNRLISISSNNSSLPSLNFQYDNEGNKTVIQRTNDPLYSETFAYDAGYRLTNYKQGTLNGNTISSPVIQNSYTYDAVGNRTSANLNGVNTNYAVNNLNQYTNVNGVNFTYDGNGNLTYDGNFYMRYDANGRKIVDSSASIVYRYQYDAFGRRIVKSVNGIPTNYYYSGLKQIEERNASDDVTGNEIFESTFMPLVRLNNNQKYFHHLSHLNSTEAITDSMGNVIERYKYQDFGKTSFYNAQNNLIAGSTINNRFLFTGQEYDAHNGSYQFHFRNYSTATGSFLQRDPIGYGDQMGMYQYVGNNPGSFTDKLGLVAPCPDQPRLIDQTEYWASWVNGLGSWTEIAYKKQLMQQLIQQEKELDFYIELATKQRRSAITLLQELKTTLQQMKGLKEGNAVTKLGSGLGKLGTGLNLLDWGIKSYKFGEAIDNYSQGTGDGYQLTKAGGNMVQSGLGATTTIGAAYNLFDFTQEKLLTGQSMNDNAEYAGQFYGEGEFNAELKLRKWTGIGDQSDESFESWQWENGTASKWEAARRRREERERRYRMMHSHNDDCPPNNNNNGNQHPNPPNSNNPLDWLHWIIELILNHDPNLIIGPDGVQTKKWVSINDRLPYSVLFENDTTATAPVKVVKVVYPIDPKQDVNTFQLGSFGFNNLTFNVPNGVNTYSQRLDVRDSLGLYVDVTAGVDGVNHQAFWIFESIDPITLLPTNDPLKGFLLLQDTTKPNNGHGFVNFSIKPVSTAQTGDTISAHASIVFDANDTIPTNHAFNTIDALPPTTNMNSIVQNLAAGKYRISWNGQDDAGGSGLAAFNLYVSVNNKPFTLYLSNVTDTFTVFTGIPDSTYCFFVSGIDSVNNKENLVNSCRLTLLPTVNPLPLTWLDFNGVRRNNDALLNWTITNEINTSYYSVERSLNGTQFSAIGTVQARGNSNSLSQYSFTDRNIVALDAPVIYYRIREVDVDGRYFYSRVIALRIESSQNEPLITAFPNPFNQYITLQVTPAAPTDKINRVQLYSTSGALLYQKEIGRAGVYSGVLNDLPQLASGMYLLKIIVNDVPYVTKLMKE
jgi:RHS repeat-associated protein